MSPIDSAARRTAWPNGQFAGPAPRACNSKPPNSAANMRPPKRNSSRLKPTGGRRGSQPASIPCRRGKCWPGHQRQQTLVQQAQTVRQRTARWSKWTNESPHIADSCGRVNVLTGAPVANALHGVPSERFGNAAEGFNSGETWDATQASLDGLLARSDSILEQVKETTESRRHWEREKNRLAKA